MVRSSHSATARSEHRGKTPVRTCVGCKKRAAAGELLRVVAQDGRLVADIRRRLPGRGAWLHPEPECLAKAERRRAFPRALKVPGVLDAAGVRQHLEKITVGMADRGTAPVRMDSRKQVDPS
ncbi:YlxR family protein [Amycolatopsis thermalba]|uniref:YlxR family protein n=1 Tax=Amycolatopsis thermalba TaxID=944492 RepID=A0ABY4NVD3_9PSEU|nr:MULTISPECIES: YlxR family protein [Amycolatopsis]OXM71996.1 nucleotide-binding protein [Amycolatopsis sp. KNN50.9b]UQS24036.1 YlxR family protein [Amycolatopsis thermalba]